MAEASGGRFGPDVHGVYERFDEFRDWAAGASLPPGDTFDPAQLGAPSPTPRQLFAIGLNYRAHADESGFAAPPSPAVFTKFASSITGPYSEVTLPDGKVDWEVELVAVIGRHARHVAAEHAWEHVAGLTIGQDLSERVLQMVGAAPQFSLGKSYPGFTPMGPWLVTPDEFGDPDDLELSCDVDGVQVQKGRTSELIFSVPALVEQLSAVLPLWPGDVIFTGTPAGVGVGRSPQVFLRDGQTLTSTIEGIGHIRQVLRSAS
ncbi:MAG: fumarylacetoacetate hydrolase family protein [Pseudonocardia sp.]|nr:fumarylacetoacetate hydrolase family protein [Pseudonocardia sp.]